MVYTCFEMIRDCRADRPEGWRYFASNYVPAVRRILLQYAGTDASLETALRTLGNPASNLFQSLDPAPERYFLAGLRQAVLADIAVPPPAIPLNLATLSEALDPLSMTERQMVWFETMHYDPATTAELLRISRATVEKARGRAAELIRAKVDSWSQTLFADNGVLLGREAAASAGADCLAAKAFVDVLDGRTSWRNRELIEQHVKRCWHCLDHFCRMVEVVGLLRSCRPLTGAEATPYWKVLGVEAGGRRSLWQRLTARHHKRRSPL